MPQLSLTDVIAEYDRCFSERWHRIFNELPRQENRIWFAGPSAYVFSVSGVRFAVDLQIRRKKDFDAVLPSLLSDTAPLSFILITHQHDDHMCIPLMQTLKDTPIRWIVPHDTRADLLEESGIRKENLILIHPGERFEAGPVTAEAFFSPHVLPDDEPFPQCGYILTTPHGKILMPGDVRDYSYGSYPAFGEIDLCLSHLWAGNDALHPEKYLPMLEKFTRFSAQFHAKRYFLGHLYELGRKELYMWHEGHAAIAARNLRSLLPSCTVEVPPVGESRVLFPEEKQS